MFTKIKDPLTKQKYSIFSLQGKKFIKKTYIQQFNKAKLFNQFGGGGGRTVYDFTKKNGL